MPEQGSPSGEAVSKAAPLGWRILEGAGLAGVLFLAGVLRLGWPGVNSFGYDEARLSLLALQMARGGDVARMGLPSSTGVPNLPAAVWLMAVPFRLSADPLLASLAIGLAGVLAVLGTWWLAREAWGPWAGLTAAALLAASPFAALYSRAIWAQDLLAPLAVLWAVAAALGIGRHKAWALALHIFIAGLALQVHYAGIVLLPATAWLFVRFRLWRRWRPVLAGAAPATLAALPFAYALHRAPDVRAAFMRLLQLPAQVDATALRKLAEMGAGTHWEWLLLGEGWTWPQALARALTGASVVVGALIVVGLTALLWQALRRLRSPDASPRAVLAALVPVWAAAAPLVFLRHSTPAHHQYQLPALPALFLAAGAATGLARRPGWGPALTALALVASLAQTVPVAQGLGVVAARLTPGGIGTPLLWPQAAARTLTDGRPIVVHSHGDDPATGGDAAGFDVLLWGYPHRIADGRSVLLIPEGPAHLFFTFADLPAWSEAAACGLDGETQVLPRREGEPPYLALTVSGVDLENLQPAGPVALANGAELQGWRVRMVDGRLRVTTCWRIVGPLVPGDYHQFNHLRNTAGDQPVAVSDAPLSSQAWQVGDTLIAWADFDRPAASGPYWIDVGMYTWPDVQRTPVLGRPGDPLSPIRLGLFDWPE